MFKTFKKICAAVLVAAAVLSLSACGNQREHVLIYLSNYDYEIELIDQRLKEQFPQYDITLEFVSTGDQAAKLLAEGLNADADMTYTLEFGYLSQLAEKGYLADLSDFSIPNYTEDARESDCYLAQQRFGGAIVIDPAILAEKGLEEPTSYQDLLKPEYKNLISMPNPKSSGTGYMFLKSLVNAWGEEKAFAYFDELTPNILQYSSSGSAPINSVLQGETAIAFGSTGQAVKANSEGANLKILYFDEGSPYAMYGMAIIKGKEERQAVRDVFDFMLNTYTLESCQKFFPEKIYADRDFVIDNYPQDIHYADMSNDSFAEKERLLELWKY